LRLEKNPALRALSVAQHQSLVDIIADLACSCSLFFHGSGNLADLHRYRIDMVEDFL
jgi:hypothetical protein